MAKLRAMPVVAAWAGQCLKPSVLASHLGQNRGFFAKAAASCCCRAPLTQRRVPPGLRFGYLIALANFHPVLLGLLVTWQPARMDVRHCLHPYFSSILILIIFNIWVWGLRPFKLSAFGVSEDFQGIHVSPCAFPSLGMRAPSQSSE